MRGFCKSDHVYSVTPLSFMHVQVIPWKAFNIAKDSYGSLELVIKFKHTNIIPLQNFSYETFVFDEHILAISKA